MLKKITTILISVVLLFLLSPRPSLAIGQQCCPAGYNYIGGGCRRSTPQICKTAMAVICVVGGGANPTVAQVCADAGSAACDAPNTANAVLTGDPTFDCQVIFTAVFGTTATTIPSDIKATIQTACVGAISAISVNAPTACTTGESCYHNVCFKADTYFLCDQVPDQYRNKCETCLNSKGIWTGVGCVEQSANGVVAKFMQVGLGIAGGIGLLMILIAGFMLSTSQGEPKRTGEAREILTAAIIGLLFIIFSVTILQFIGVTILHIPEFGL